VMTDEAETIEWDHLPDDFQDEWHALRLDQKTSQTQIASPVQTRHSPEYDEPQHAVAVAASTRPQFNVRSNFSIQAKGAGFGTRQNPAPGSGANAIARSKTSLFDVQVHRSGSASGTGNKGTGLDQTFSKFREGRFDGWTHTGKPAAREDIQSNLMPQQVNRFKDDGFDTRAYDARAQGYLGSRQAASRVPVENPINLDDLESRAIQEALETCRGNVSAAARMLGISRNTIYRRLNAK